MKMLLAVDESEYTTRMLSYLSAHKDPWGISHAYTAFHATPSIPHRAAAFASPEVAAATTRTTPVSFWSPFAPSWLSMAWTPRSTTLNRSRVSVHDRSCRRKFSQSLEDHLRALHDEAARHAL